jgi:hypothetical protein
MYPWCPSHLEFCVLICVVLLCCRFVASFAVFSDLTNDECTRTFLCMEVGAGQQEVSTFPFQTLEESEFDISSSARSRMRLLPPCIRSARKDIMNSHVSTHRSPGSPLTFRHKVHRPKLHRLWKHSPLLRSWMIPQARTHTLSPLSRISPRTLSLR